MELLYIVGGAVVVEDVGQRQMGLHSSRLFESWYFYIYNSCKTCTSEINGQLDVI